MEEEIIKLIAEQVVRDFDRFGLFVSFSGKASRHMKLFLQLNQHLEDLLLNQSAKLECLLYQIDVDQKKASRKENISFPKNSLKLSLKENWLKF